MGLRGAASRGAVWPCVVLCSLGVVKRAWLGTRPVSRGRQRYRDLSGITVMVAERTSGLGFGGCILSRNKRDVVSCRKRPALQNSADDPSAS
jgi:hypothetical protein